MLFPTLAPLLFFFASTCVEEMHCFFLCLCGCILDFLLDLFRLFGLALRLFAATEKSLPRCRLALAQEAARGPLYVTSFVVLFRFLNSMICVTLHWIDDVEF